MLYVQRDDHICMISDSPYLSVLLARTLRVAFPASRIVIGIAAMVEYGDGFAVCTQRRELIVLD